jgi:aspartate racemase
MCHADRSRRCFVPADPPTDHTGRSAGARYGVAAPARQQARPAQRCIAVVPRLDSSGHALQAAFRAGRTTRRMKTIGMIGGMSWESTLLYYRLINQTVRDQLGGLHSARLLLYSVDFHDIEKLQRSGDWERAGAAMAEAARALQAAGADFLILCTNTMHRVAESIEAAVPVPLLHIADATAASIRQAGLQRVGLLGTRFTMEQDFYRQRMRAQGVDVLVPDAAGRDDVHRIIYEELCQGRIIDTSRERYRQVIADLIGNGAEAVILGCTEITLLIDANDAAVPLFDTTALHARAAALHSVAAG